MWEKKKRRKRKKKLHVTLIHLLNIIFHLTPCLDGKQGAVRRLHRSVQAHVLFLVSYYFLIYQIIVIWYMIEWKHRVSVDITGGPCLRRYICARVSHASSERSLTRRSTTAILLGRGASASTREREEPEETETVQDLWLREDIIHVWADRGIGSRHNAHNHPAAEGECSLQENIGRLHAWDNVSLLANVNASLSSSRQLLQSRASS